MTKAKVILIAGPTASGKSALALDIARRDNGVLINADAMQVYSGLPILSAQPTAEEQTSIPHRLYAVFDPAEKSSAGTWQRLALTAMDEVWKEGRTPILVGGTGLYFRALLGGLADIPDIPQSVRDRTQEIYNEIGEEKFRTELARLDPASAGRIARNDRQRLIRAYEVATHTGQPIGDWQKNNPSLPFDALIEKHLLLPERAELYKACDRRFTKMIERGAIEEAESFLKRNLDPDLPSMKTLGLREIRAYLCKECTLDEAIEKAQQMTRNYAKRQMTWFRNQWKPL